jgi:hypothetical protein
MRQPQWGLAARADPAILGAMPKVRPAIRYGIDALLILIPLLGMTYFLFDPEAFNAFLAWLAKVLQRWDAWGRGGLTEPISFASLRRARPSRYWRWAARRMFPFRSLCRGWNQLTDWDRLTLEHSVNYVPFLFRVDGERRIMVRAVAEEALALASVTLFLAMVAVWVQVLVVV